MNPDLFSSDAAGKVIKAGRGKASYWAFIPNPLPPDIPVDWQLAGVLSQADRALSELAGLGRSMPNPNLFLRPLMRREAVLSSRIEGTRSDLNALYKYEAVQLSLPGLEEPSADFADVHEVYNYVRALEYGLERLDTLPVSLHLIREIHARLLQGVRGEYATPGEFRITQNWIGGDTLNQAVFVPPPVQKMLDSLGQFERYLHQQDDHPPLVRLSFIHYQFEAIHPFVDGNGRIGRLLLALLLVHWKLLPLPLFYLSAYFERHRHDYYDFLLAVSQRGAWRDWVLFFLRGIVSQAESTSRRLKQLQDLQDYWRGVLQMARLRGYAYHLLNLLFERPVLTIPQTQRELGISYRSAKRNIDKFIELGLVKQLDEATYAKTFYAPDIMEVILQDDDTEE